MTPSELPVSALHRLAQRAPLSRRHLFHGAGGALASWAFASLAAEGTSSTRAVAAETGAAAGGLPGFPHLPVKARRVIYLFQSGAPSQLDLFDFKPGLANLRGTELPDSIRRGQRLTGMTATQTSFPVAPTKYTFAPRGKSGALVSDLLPHIAGVADELCFIKTLHTEAINHDPAITFFQTGTSTRGASEHRILGELWTRQRECRPTGLHRADELRERAA